VQLQALRASSTPAGMTAAQDERERQLLQLQAQLTDKHTELVALEDEYRKRDEELEAEFDTLNQQIAEYNKRAKELNTLKEQFFNEKQEWRAKMGAVPSPANATGAASGRASPSFFGAASSSSVPTLRSPSPDILNGATAAAAINGHASTTATGSPLAASGLNGSADSMPSLPIHAMHTSTHSHPAAATAAHDASHH
jgi:ABC-type transporter Mla subunit MlaD